MRYLIFESSDTSDGVITFDAMASTSAEQHAAVLAEAQAVLDWAWENFPHTHGPSDEGMAWDHDMQVQVEGNWHTVTLTLTASPHFAEAFEAAFGQAG